MPDEPRESLVGLDLALVVAVEEGDDAADRVVQPHEVRRRLARRYGALQDVKKISVKRGETVLKLEFAKTSSSGKGGRGTTLINFQIAALNIS